MQDTAFDDLLANIYLAATDPRVWPRALWQTQAMLGVQSARLCGHVPHTQRIAFCFEAHPDSGDPRPSPHAPQGSQDASPWTTWPLHEGEQLHVTLQVQAQHPASPAWLQDATLANRLVRHFRQAVNVSLVHAKAVGASLIGRDILQQVRHPLLVLDESRRVLFCNRQAEGLLGGHPMLNCADGMLRCTEDVNDARLLLAIRSLRLSARSYLGKSASQDRVFLSLRAPGRAHLGVYLHALRGCATMGSHMPRNLALVLLHEPSIPVPLDALMVAATWQMTPAEASVALAVREGMDAHDIAAQRRVSVNTVRSQLQQAMAKMAVTKQTELVCRLGTLPSHAAHRSLP